MNEEQKVDEILKTLPPEEVERRRVACANQDQSWKRWKDYFQSAWNSMVNAYPQSAPQQLVNMSLLLADTASVAVDERMKDHVQKKFVILTTGQVQP